MKKALLILFVILIHANGHAQTDISEKITGQWILNRAKVSEKPASGEMTERQLDLPGKLTIYFKSNNTGNFNFADKDSEPFTWVIVKNKVVITYSGNHELLKSFNGDFRAIIRDRKGEQKLEMSRANFSASLSR